MIQLETLRRVWENLQRTGKQEIIPVKTSARFISHTLYLDIIVNVGPDGNVSMIWKPAIWNPGVAKPAKPTPEQKSEADKQERKPDTKPIIPIKMYEWQHRDRDNSRCPNKGDIVRTAPNDLPPPCNGPGCDVVKKEIWVDKDSGDKLSPRPASYEYEYQRPTPKLEG